MISEDFRDFRDPSISPHHLSVFLWNTRTVFQYCCTLALITSSLPLTMKCSGIHLLLVKYYNLQYPLKVLQLSLCGTFKDFRSVFLSERKRLLRKPRTFNYIKDPKEALTLKGSSVVPLLELYLVLEYSNNPKPPWTSAHFPPKLKWHSGVFFYKKPFAFHQWRKTCSLCGHHGDIVTPRPAWGHITM